MSTDQDQLLDRFRTYIKTWNPYQPGNIDPYRLADLLERKDGPKDYQYEHPKNEREWSIFKDRVSLYVVWGVNWVFGIQLWGDRDYGLLDFDLGPLRFHFYARWGLEEIERMDRWIRHE